MSMSTTTLVRDAVWRSKIVTNDLTDNITVKNLQATVNAGVDVWNRKKQQPALITVTLHVAKSFESAAATDSLDSSTVHYGKLSKDLKARVEHESTHYQSTSNLIGNLAHQTMETAQVEEMVAPGSTGIAAMEIGVHYPKASMLGDGVTLSYASFPHAGVFSRVIHLRDVRVACLVGVNSNERLQKQALVVNLWIECLPVARFDDYPALEAVVVKVTHIQFMRMQGLISLDHFRIVI
jgi:dihydroneopterin aldolase